MYIIFDLDNTILNNQGEVSLYTFSVLERARRVGHKIVFNTARSLGASKRLIELLKPDYAILNAGSLVVDSNQQIIYEKLIDKQIVNEIVQTILKLTPRIGVETPQGFYTFDAQYQSQFGIYLDSDVPCGAYKIVAYSDDNTLIEKLAKQYNLEYTNYNEGKWYRISPQSINKWQGIVEMFKVINDDITNIITFGDDLGDLEMLLNASTGVAMANSVSKVLEQVKIITLSNDEDGVAVYLEENIL